jgi:hypothetical protein
VKEVLEIINQTRAAGITGKHAVAGAIGPAFYLEPTSPPDIGIFIWFDGTAGNPLDPARKIIDCPKPFGAGQVREHFPPKGWLFQFIPAEDALQKAALAEAVFA